MRPQKFLDWVKDYNIEKLQDIIGNDWLNGGWEVWLQVELSMFLGVLLGQNNIYIEREVVYPSTRSGSAAKRCDFYIAYSKKGGKDETYIELKCQNASEDDSLNKVIIRLTKDIQKQEQPSIAGDPGFCLAAVHCTPEDMEMAIDCVYQEVRTVTSVFLLNWETGKIYDMTLKNQLEDLKNDLGKNDATFLMSVSP